MAGDLDAFVDADSLAVIKDILGALAEAGVVEILEMRHVCEKVVGNLMGVSLLFSFIHCCLLRYSS